MELKRLSYNTLRELGSQDYILEDAPVRILQFGEGNFLRGFVDYFIDVLNETQNFKSKIEVIQPLIEGTGHIINEQDGLYQLYLRGIEKNKKINQRRLISCIERVINPYEEYEAFLELAHNKDIKYIISNTTEAGISFDETCSFNDTPPKSFPAKLTRYLYERFISYESAAGFVILPCELIDNNGTELIKCVIKYANMWNLGDSFTKWINEENIFCNTLVDRIVTGYPKKEAEILNVENGYIDKVIDTAEIFGLWVIEGPEFLKKELPFEKAGLPVIFTNDYRPYRQRKVRVLNGAHTSMVLAAYLYGENIVRNCMENEVIFNFIKETIFDEIIPTLSLPKDELMDFASDVIERFKNPYIDHNLLDISLNSVSKWKSRVLPTMKDYYELNGCLPKNILFSFAALIAFYSGTEINNGRLTGYRHDQKYYINDTAQVLKFFKENSKELSSTQLVEKFAGPGGFFEEDLTNYPGFVENVSLMLSEIMEMGMKKVLK